MNDIVKLSEAACFAAQVHTGQTRKGADREPHVNHLAEVAAFVAQASGGRDVDLVVAAWLHDAIEDRNIERGEIAARFGEGVADLVIEVTDDKGLPKAERKRKQVDTVARKSRRARLLKLADKTSNVKAIFESPPADWSQQRIEEYARWAQDVVDAGCRGLNPELEAMFDRAVAQVLRAG